MEKGLGNSSFDSLEGSRYFDDFAKESTFFKYDPVREEKVQGNRFGAP
jgi:hypothetical protein